MPVLANIRKLITCRADGRQDSLHEIDKAALAWKGEKIVWAGPDGELPESFRDGLHYDAGNKMVIPGLVDCHTHLAFGGWRADEFEMRCLGKSYLEIARSGGGILSTVQSTRETSRDELAEKSQSILNEAVALGITTMECKSGYGLDTENELKLLSVYAHLKNIQPVRIVPTFLGAHTVPPEYRDRRSQYVDLVIREMIPEVASAKLALFCDVFADDAAFSTGESRRVLEAGLQAGLAPKIHADQLSASGGAELAADLEAVSADHLEQISEQGIRQMARSGVVAVSLPLATYYLGQKPMPARRLIKAGVRVAVSTDFNPGSAPSYHLPLAMNMACVMQKMSPAEVLKGATLYAAAALKMDQSTGSLEPGKYADFAIIDAPDVNHWLYHFRANACRATFIRGMPVFGEAVKIRES